MSEDWTLSQRIDRRVGRRLRVVNSGIRPRRLDIVPKRSDVVRRQHADWAIRRRRGRCAERLDKAPEEPMTYRTT